MFMKSESQPIFSFMDSISSKSMSPTCHGFDLWVPFLSFFFTVFTKGCVCLRIFICMQSPHIHGLVIKQQIPNLWWGQCAGKKSGEESLCSFPSKTLTLLIFSSHQCNCSSVMSLILKTLDTTFMSISPIRISISSSSFNLLFLKHLPVLRRSLSLNFFCRLNFNTEL